MSANEIRDSVLSSATQIGRAKEYLLNEEIEAIEYTIKDAPSFLFQATSIPELCFPLDIPSSPFIQHLFSYLDEKSRSNFSPYVLSSEKRPFPSINGVIAIKDNRDNTWQLDIHRTGFIQLIFWDIQCSEKGSYILDQNCSKIFENFCNLCENTWNFFNIDSTYFFRCKYLNADKTEFDRRDHGFRRIPYKKRNIIWPDQLRQIGDSVEPIWKKWEAQLFHAFGLDWHLPQ